jgi:hypothetical protein
MIINIPEDFKNIQDGLNNAAAGDIVVVASGKYLENITWPYVDNITLTGVNQNDCIIDGSTKTSVIDIILPDIHMSAKVSGITLINGFALHGGGISFFGGILTINDVTLKNNKAKQGLGIYSVGDSSLILNNVIIKE